jgi:putative DNA-invertase from lambdoid prophage Rac
VSKLNCFGRDAPDILETIKILPMLDVEVVVFQLSKLDLTPPMAGAYWPCWLLLRR